MPSPTANIVDIYNEVVSSLAALGSTTAHYFGQHWLDDNTDDGNRIVWVPLDADFGPPIAKGAQPFGDTSLGITTSIPKQLNEDRQRVAFHIWAVFDPSTADTLSNPNAQDVELAAVAECIRQRDILITQLHTTLCRNNISLSGEWRPWQNDERGACYTLTVSLSLAVWSQLPSGPDVDGQGTVITIDADNNAMTSTHDGVLELGDTADTKHITP
jgi:hypothetical protein